MRLLFINQYYWPDMAATSQMMADLCRRLARRGHDVHVLCSRGKYDDGSGGGGRTAAYEKQEGVHIHRVGATGFGKASMVGRVADYGSFHLLIGLRTLLTGWRYDAVVTLTTPPLIGIYGTMLRAVSRTRHVCWSMDLHPDCEFELGVFSRRAVGPRLLDWLNGLHFRRADRCVVLGPYMGRRLEAKGVSPRRLAEIPVWGHEPGGCGVVNPDARPAEAVSAEAGAEPAAGGTATSASEPSSLPRPSLRDELGLSGRFVVMYSGNAGIIHTFTAVCEAALRLRHDPRFAFLFVGGGRRLEEVAQFKARHQLDSIVIRGYFPREKLDQSLAMADVHLITLRENMAGVAVPCKLYGIMAAGRPAIFVGPDRCETADAIRNADCGWTLSPDDPEGLANTLVALADDPIRLAQAGCNARAAYDDTYNADACGRQWQELLESL